MRMIFPPRRPDIGRSMPSSSDPPSPGGARPAGPTRSRDQCGSSRGCRSPRAAEVGRLTGMALILAGGAVLTMDATGRLVPEADLRIEGTDIAAIDPAGSPRRPGDEVIDCRHTLITPGLVNTHTHAYAALLRGLAEDKPRGFWS